MANEVALSSLGRLIAEQACRDLVLQTAAFTDARADQDFAALFTEDGVLVRPGAQPLQGRAAIVESYRSKPAGRITRHMVSNTLVVLESDTQASATSCVVLWSGLASDPVGPFGRPAQARQVVGEFEDHFQRTTEGWRISRREARFVLFREESA